MGMTSEAGINTKRVEGRRAVRYESLDEALADVQGLIDAGEVRGLGNWTPAQNILHVATAIDFAIDGYPPEARQTPRLVRLFMRLFKRRMLEKGFGPGIRPPEKIARTFRPDPAVTIEAAMSALRRSVQRSKDPGMTHPSPLMGSLTQAEYERFHCRHAELHFSFVVPA